MNALYAEHVFTDDKTTISQPKLLFFVSGYVKFL